MVTHLCLQFAEQDGVVQEMRLYTRMKTIKSCAFHSQSRMGVVQEVRLYDGHTRDSCVTQDSCVKSQEVRLSQE